MLEVGVDLQKILCYWTKYAFLPIIYSLAIFSLGCIKTPWGAAPKFGNIFLEHLLYMKGIFLFVDMLSHFEVTCFRVTAVRVKKFYHHYRIVFHVILS